MIDVQALNNALMALGFCVGLAILLSVSIVVAAAVAQRHERKEHVRSIERHLADVTKQQDPAAAR